MSDLERRVRWENAIIGAFSEADVIHDALALADAEQADLQAELERLNGVVSAMDDIASGHLDRALTAEATIERVRALIADTLADADTERMGTHWDGCHKVHHDCLGVGIRAALNAPTKPAPALERDPDAPTGVAPPDGYSTWLNPGQVTAHDPPRATTYWNGQPTPATRGTAIIADAPEFPAYWAKLAGIIGERIPVVRVDLDGVNYGGGTCYLDDRDGMGWVKVTEGRGSGRYGHSDVAVVAGSFKATT